MTQFINKLYWKIWKKRRTNYKILGTQTTTHTQNSIQIIIIKNPLKMWMIQFVHFFFVIFDVYQICMLYSVAAGSVQWNNNTINY